MWNHDIYTYDNNKLSASPGKDVGKYIGNVTL